MKDLLTVAKARHLLTSKQISALELTKEILRCIHATEDKVASYVTITEELALQQADEADKCIRKGQMYPLTGIPMQIKDNYVFMTKAALLLQIGQSGYAPRPQGGLVVSEECQACS